MRRNRTWILFLLLSLSPLRAETDEIYDRAGEDLLAGRWEQALEGYRLSSASALRETAERSKLRVVQLELELGRYEGLPERCVALLAENPEEEISRQVLIVEIFSLLRLKRDGEALALMESGNGVLAGSPSTALLLSDAYRQSGKDDEAARLEWIIRRDFPDSPESLILKGGGDRSVTPRSLLSLP